MNDWRTLTLGEALTFQRGFDITKDLQRDGLYPVISSSGPKTSHAEFKVRGPGVIIGRKGSLGTVFYSEGDYWPHDTTLWVKDFHGNHPRFAYYFLQTMGFERLDAGASNPSLNRNHIHTIPVRWPPLPVQRRIAGILSAYDELIENNQRRIGILEGMARALYREWFVHFRFPGYEKVKSVPSPAGREIQGEGGSGYTLGPIPQGWEWQKLSELGFVGRGKSRHRPRNEPSLYGGPYPFFQTGDVKEARIFLRTHAQTYSEAGLSQSKLWQPGILCITIAANIAETAILAKTGCFPDSVVGFVPDPEKSDAFYVKMYLDSIKQQMQNVSRGTTQDNLSLEKLLAFRVLSPPPSIIRPFRERVSPMLELVNLLLQREDALCQTRDLLLPRLLSGQVALA